MNVFHLSEGHPLIADENKPWPWKVTIGYRSPGARKVTFRREVFVRAAGFENAMSAGIRIAREMIRPEVNGSRVIPSRPLGARPLDRADQIGGY